MGIPKLHPNNPCHATKSNRRRRVAVALGNMLFFMEYLDTTQYAI